MYSILAWKERQQWFVVTVTHTHTCRMASLCISWPSQAGIISFRTPNSSFILVRLRRSIRLWAVLRAIFRLAAVFGPAAEAFRRAPAVVVVEEVVAVIWIGMKTLLRVGTGAVGSSNMKAGEAADDMEIAAAGSSSSFWPRGFIWMIFLLLVGGGGTVYAQLFRRVDAARLCVEGVVGGGDCEVIADVNDTLDRDAVDEFLVVVGDTDMAAGGRENEASIAPGLAWISLEATGVGSPDADDMMVVVIKSWLAVTVLLAIDIPVEDRLPGRSRDNGDNKRQSHRHVRVVGTRTGSMIDVCTPGGSQFTTDTEGRG
jgi:hypothetical protein